MPSVEEVEACPKCGLRGEQTTRNKLPDRRGTMVGMTCRNSRCTWFESGWAYQLRSDGTIPEADSQPRPKSFPALHVPNAKRMVENLEGLLEQSLKEGKNL